MSDHNHIARLRDLGDRAAFEPVAFHEAADIIATQAARITKLETALTLIASFEPRAGKRTNFATAVAIAKEAMKDA